MPQPLNPAHLVIQPQSQIHPQSGTQPPMYLPSAQPTTPSAAQVAPYAIAPAAHAPHIVLSATPRLESKAGTSSPMTSARVQSVQSSAPPSMRSGVTAPDMSHRTPSEQAVIQALQAVANYPESRDFVETVSRQMPGLQNLLGSRGQQEGCLTTREGQGPSTDPLTPSTTATRNRAPSSKPGLSPVSDEELGRKRASPHELAQLVGNNDSPTSCSPPDKRNNVLRSVMIQEPKRSRPPWHLRTPDDDERSDGMICSEPRICAREHRQFNALRLLDSKVCEEFHGPIVFLTIGQCIRVRGNERC